MTPFVLKYSYIIGRKKILEIEDYYVLLLKTYDIFKT